jgi:uncharacterized damage-inducible protein DinB
MKTRIENYIRQLNQLYDGDNWVDATFLDRVYSLDESKAFIQPHPGNHSVAELLWHCIYWRKVVMKRITGDLEYEAQTESTHNFLPIKTLKEKGWEYLLSEFNNTQKSLIEFLDLNTDEFLEKEFKPGHKIDFEIEGIIQHDIYHLGQIGLVIAILNKKLA